MCFRFVILFHYALTSCSRCPFWIILLFYMNIFTLVNVLFMLHIYHSRSVFRDFTYVYISCLF